MKLYIFLVLLMQLNIKNQLRLLLEDAINRIRWKKIIELCFIMGMYIQCIIS